MRLIALSKLFAWTVDHVFKKKNAVIRRNERGIVKACDIDEARKLLQRSVCTALSENLVVVEIPDKMMIYSLGHKDITTPKPD